MTRSRFIIIAACALCLLCIALPVHAMLNPSAVYCRAMGYQYEIGNLPDGNQVGYCRMPNNEWVIAWKFLRGQAGQKYNYCSKNGYDTKVSPDPKTCSVIRDTACTVCVLPDGREVEVTTLMNLNLYETTCGDGRCVITENYRNCPADCPQSGNDGACQTKMDLRCDPDCIGGKGDIDCMFPGNPLSTILAVLVVLVVIGGAAWYILKKRKQTSR